MYKTPYIGISQLDAKSKTPHELDAFYFPLISEMSILKYQRPLLKTCRD